MKRYEEGKSYHFSIDADSCEQCGKRGRLSLTKNMVICHSCDLAEEPDKDYDRTRDEEVELGSGSIYGENRHSQSHR